MRTGSFSILVLLAVLGVMISASTANQSLQGATDRFWKGDLSVTYQMGDMDSTEIAKALARSKLMDKALTKSGVYVQGTQTLSQGELKSTIRLLKAVVVQVSDPEVVFRHVTGEQNPELVYRAHVTVDRGAIEKRLDALSHNHDLRQRLKVLVRENDQLRQHLTDVTQIQSATPLVQLSRGQLVSQSLSDLRTLGHITEDTLVPGKPTLLERGRLSELRLMLEQARFRYLLHTQVYERMAWGMSLTSKVDQVLPDPTSPDYLDVHVTAKAALKNDWRVDARNAASTVSAADNEAGILYGGRFFFRDVDNQWMPVSAAGGLSPNLKGYMDAYLRNHVMAGVVAIGKQKRYIQLVSLDSVSQPAFSDPKTYNLGIKAVTPATLPKTYHFVFKVPKAKAANLQDTDTYLDIVAKRPSQQDLFY